MGTLDVHGARDQPARPARAAAGAGRRRATTSPTRAPPGTRARRAVLVASPAYAMPGVSTAPAGAGQLGTGVDVAAYQRIRDAFLDVQYRAQSMLQGQAQAQPGRPPAGAARVQRAHHERPQRRCSPTTGRRGRTSRTTPRTWARARRSPSRRRASPTGFTSLSGAADDAAVADGPERRRTRSTRSTRSAPRSPQLNVTISKLEVAGDTPNDLLDQRDVLLDKLSALGNVSITAGANGSVDVSFGGASLVTGRRPRATLAESDLTEPHLRQAAGPDHAARHDDPGLPDAS